MLAAALMCVAAAGPTVALYPADQAVTFADFSYVRYIAASMEQVYFATTGGIIRYDQFARQWNEPMTMKAGIDNADVRRIWIDDFDDHLYVETSEGYFEYDFTLEQWYSANGFPTTDKATRHISPPDMMLPPPGFNYLADGRLIDPWGRTFSISDLLDDGTGDLWIGTWGYGAAKAPTGSKMIDMLPYGLLQSRVNAMYADDGYLWVSGAVFDEARTGITGIDPASLEFSHIESGVRPDFPVVDVNCLAAESDRLYIGTPFGLYIMNPDTRYVERTITKRYGLWDENVISLEVNGDTVYIGTSDGLSFVTGASDSVALVRPTQFSGQAIWDLEQFGEYLWIGSSAGAFRYDPSTGTLQRYQDPEQVLFSDVYDIESWKEYLWFASDAGLVQLNTETARSRSFHEAIQRITPRALAVNDTIAAVASDKGMTVLFHANRKPFTRDFTTADGLASDYVFALEMDGDYIWIGTDAGLTRFLWNNPNRVD